MSDILSPQGFEPNEPLQDTDIQEVYQPTSPGLRRNKQVTLATLKLFFRKLTIFTPNNIMESDGTGTPRTTSIATSAVSQSITDTNNNTNAIAANINQGVKTTDTPTFADATIASHAIDSELSTLNNRVNQGVKTTDTPTFFDLILSGVSSVKNSIIDLLSRMTATESATGTNATNIGNNATAIGVNASNISNNDTDILNLQTKTPQSYKTTDDVEFNSVKTDSISEKNVGAGISFVNTVNYKFHYKGTAQTQDDVYSAIIGLIPNINDAANIVQSQAKGGIFGTTIARFLGYVYNRGGGRISFKEYDNVALFEVLQGDFTLCADNIEIMSNFDIL